MKYIIFILGITIVVGESLNSDNNPELTKKIVLKRSAKDLGDKSGAYIYRQDGELPAQVVYLNPDNVFQYVPDHKTSSSSYDEQGVPYPFLLQYSDGVGLDRPKKIKSHHYLQRKVKPYKRRFPIYGHPEVETFSTPIVSHPAAYSFNPTFGNPGQPIPGFALDAIRKYTSVNGPLYGSRSLDSYYPETEKIYTPSFYYNYKPQPYNAPRSYAITKTDPNAEVVNYQDNGPDQPIKRIQHADNENDEEETDSKRKSDYEQPQHRPLASSIEEIETGLEYDNDKPNYQALVVPLSHQGKHEEGFKKEDGSKYENEDHSKKGYKTSKGHKSEEKFEKGKKGKHDEEEHKHEYDEKGEKKKSYHDEKDEHGSHHKEEEGEKGGKFDEKKKHRKGAKTSGYHNVFHKDEYVKDHTFYDDEDHSGKFQKYGKHHKYHNDEEADKKKGAHHKSGHKKGEKAGKGHYSKSHYDDDDTAYKKEHKHEEDYKKGESYAEKGGDEHHSHHGHKSKH